MSITLELGPKLEERLLGEAATRGMSLETYLLSLIEGAPPLPVPEDATLEQFEAAMDAFSAGTETLPVLRPEAFTRESIYEGR